MMPVCGSNEDEKERRAKVMASRWKKGERKKRELVLAGCVLWCVVKAMDVRTYL